MLCTRNIILSFKLTAQSCGTKEAMLRNYSSLVSGEYAGKSISDKSLQAFHSSSSLQFDDEPQFSRSEIGARLLSLLNDYFQIDPNHSNKIRTIPMRKALQHLQLDSVYEELIDDDKYLIGIHGASILSLARIIPFPSEIGQMSTYHNPYHRNGAPLYFFYGDNLRMAMHYSSLNSVGTEKITGESDPDYFPHRIGVLGFVNQDVIHQINEGKKSTQTSQQQEIIVSETEAWGQIRGGMPDNFKIGNEVRIPSLYHSQISNLLVFGIKGSKRMFPLDKGIQYHNGHTCRWEKGKGYVDLDDEVHHKHDNRA